MDKLVILCVEDEPEVRDAIVRDLAPFRPICRIEATEEVEEAREVVSECIASGDEIALALVDHLLPGTHGVDFLIELNSGEATASTRKVLVTKILKE